MMSPGEAANPLVDWLREAYERSGYRSMRSLSKAAGLSPTVFSMILSGTRRPEPDTLAKIAKVFNASEAFLLELAGYLPPTHRPPLAGHGRLNQKIDRLADPRHLELLEVEVDFLLHMERGQTQDEPQMRDVLQGGMKAGTRMSRGFIVIDGGDVHILDLDEALTGMDEAQRLGIKTSLQRIQTWLEQDSQVTTTPA